MGFKGISKSEEIILKKLIDDCFLIDWSTKIKDQTIEFRKNYSLKLPDAIIAATSFVFSVPIVTADKEFSKIEELDLVLIEL